MRPNALAAIAAVATLTSTFAQAADLSGFWSTQSSGGVVEIAPCGDVVCGRLVRSPFLRIDPTLRDWRNRDAALRTRPLLGLTILSAFKGGPTAWTGGEVYNPDKGRTYAGSMELLSPDTLKVKACTSPRRCRIQVWNRLPE